MKNKFFANFKIIPISVCALVLFGVVFVCYAVSGDFVANTALTISLFVLFIVFILFSIIMLIFGFVMIEVTTEGMAVTLFSKKIKFFKWEEISEIKIRNSGKDASQEITFYRLINKNGKKEKTEKISIEFYSLDCSRIAIIKHYAPNYIIEKLEANNN